MALDRLTKDNFVKMSGPKLKVYDYWYNKIVDYLNNKLVSAPVNSNTDPADKTVLAASLYAGLLTATPGGAINYTLPTGTQMETAIGVDVLAVGGTFDFTIVNIGAGGIITVVAAAGFTIVGIATIAANTSATFRVRKTALNTFVAYRIN
jgi:hypothetical protein